MRRASITSALLIAVLAASASGCVAGWGSLLPTSCSYPSVLDRCERTNASGAAGASTARGHTFCGHVFRSLPARCGLRSFLSLQLVALRAVEIVSPLQVAVRSVSGPADSKIIVSSIGSPETDRGPPVS
jgi:hypothetical protein